MFSKLSILVLGIQNIQGNLCQEVWAHQITKLPHNVYQGLYDIIWFICSFYNLLLTNETRSQ